MSKQIIHNIHIYPSDLSNASRIEKICNSLFDLKFFDQIICLGSGHLTGPREILKQKFKIKLLGNENSTKSMLGKCLRFFLWYIKVIHYVKSLRISCVNAHSLSSLPVAVFIKYMKSCKLVYDTHELETETHSMRGLRKKIFKIIETILIKFCDEVVVVSNSISSYYAKEYKIKPPTVIYNSPEAPSTLETFSENYFRDIFNIDDSTKIFLYLGLISHGRGIKIILDAFAKNQLGDVCLIFLGNGSLVNEVKDYAIRFENIFYHDYVETNEVVRYVNYADFGLCIIEANCLSYEYCMPNKLFEYIAAGKPVIVSGLRELSKFTTKNEIGLVIEEISEIQLCRAIIDIQKYSFKHNKIRDVFNKYQWSNQSKKLNDLYKDHIFNS